MFLPHRWGWEQSQSLLKTARDGNHLIPDRQGQGLENLIPDSQRGIFLVSDNQGLEKSHPRQPEIG